MNSVAGFGTTLDGDCTSHFFENEITFFHRKGSGSANNRARMIQRITKQDL